MRIAKQYLLLFLCTAGLLVSCNQSGQTGNKQVMINPSSDATTVNEKPLPAGLDKSPMDMMFYPPDYPKLKMTGQEQEPLVARLIYSRPQKDGRKIFGNVLKYGSHWRLGANEATEIEFFKNVTIEKQKIAKGRYVLYGIPYEDNWTLILNTDLYTWGLKIDSTKDVYKFNIPIAKTNYPFEVFTMEFEKAGKGMQLVMEWDSVRAILPIQY